MKRVHRLASSCLAGMILCSLTTGPAVSADFFGLSWGMTKKQVEDKKGPGIRGGLLNWSFVKYRGQFMGKRAEWWLFYERSDLFGSKRLYAAQLRVVVNETPVSRDFDASEEMVSFCEQTRDQLIPPDIKYSFEPKIGTYHWETERTKGITFCRGMIAGSPDLPHAIVTFYDAKEGLF